MKISELQICNNPFLDLDEEEQDELYLQLLQDERQVTEELVKLSQTYYDN